MSRSPQADGPEADWPHVARSRFVEAGRLRWHIQRFGDDVHADDAPRLLLIHGTGAATHSWRHTAPALAEHGVVLSIDLPGHGFTERPSADGLSLPGMARRVADLLDELAFVPDFVIGHSAGAAILVRMALAGRLRPQRIISLNGALYPFTGRTERMFPAIARALFLNPLVPRLFALGAGRTNRVKRLLENTGSTIDADGVALYARLFGRAGHAAAALGMMARWDLDALDADIDTLGCALTLIVADNDRAVPADASTALAERLAAERIVLAGLGHLAHEEAPARVNACLLQCMGLAPADKPV